MENKFILDATAGHRMMWFNKEHPNCIYLDKRPECEPDIVADFRDLKQFPDETFKLVVFDPPHEIDKKVYTRIQEIYGVLHPETWQADIKKGFKECWRVLQPFGILIFKWNEHDKKVKELYPLFPVKPLFGQKTRSSKRRNCKLGHTFWFCFMKIPKSERNEC